MHCQICSSELKTIQEDYHFTFSGVDNAWIVGAQKFVCPACGEREAVIPRQALDEIAWQLIHKNYLLGPKEIRFLRGQMGLTGTALANVLGASPGTITRWEKGTQTISPQDDRLLRLTVAGVKRWETKKLITELFPIITPEQKETRIEIAAKDLYQKPLNRHTPASDK
jgi:putative zinc finger/helix-turn-helix YgiT family protein